VKYEAYGFIQPSIYISMDTLSHIYKCTVPLLTDP